MRTWNMIVGFGCFAGMSLGLAACGGFSNLGEGVGGEGGEGGDPATMTGGSAGTGMSTGGTVNPGTGGTMSMGTGGTTFPGTGGTMNPGTGGTMNPGAGGSMGTPTPTFSCDGQACGSMCLGIETLMDGSGRTFSGYCSADNGVCVREPVDCRTPGLSCMTTQDCLERADPQCVMCSDGTTACAKLECLMGECVPSAPAACSPQCQDVECGTPCACPDGHMCEDTAQIYATCNAKGECQAGRAECSDACMTTEDCPIVDADCVSCGGGNCATQLCLEGLCQMICMIPMESCEVDMDCPPPPPICQMCPGGSCAGTRCVEGGCVFGCNDE